MTFKPDIVSQICVYCDYPLWRLWIKKYRERVNKVILYPSKHHGVIDLEGFWKKVMPETWVEREPIDYGTEDWRQAETEPLLTHIESEWVWLQEADFFCRDWEKFFTDIERASKVSDMIGLWNPTHFPYIHPSCLLIKTEMLHKTNKDFRAHPEINGGDHFCMITRDVERLGGHIITLQELGYNCDMTPQADCFHLGGLTYVYQDWKGDGTDHFGVKSLEAFSTYNFWAQQAPIEQNDDFLSLCQEVEKTLLEKGITNHVAYRQFFLL